ncbi:hypothetical protein PD5205_01583 [Xanthomonas fragariae]|uniref:Uncharacterized protein n=1 Tax=Xanthomonas fragariae TaxID=48664 RepID=A0A1Y6HKX4_9XANT|nr:hypothetical protein PD5205_01583 [Xanthomonas fragariae]
MEIDAAFKADAQFAHACEPGMSALDAPAMTAQPVVARDPLACDPRNDAALLEEGATAVDVVSLVGVQFVWPTSQAPWFATTGLPPIGGKASINSSNTTESCRLAPVTHTAKGMPLRSTIRCRLLPSLPRSVGFGPVYGPPGGRLR